MCATVSAECQCASGQRSISVTTRIHWQLDATDQLFKASDYTPLIVALSQRRAGATGRRRAMCIDSVRGPAQRRVRQRQAIGADDRVPAARRQHHRTVDRIRAVLPQLQASIPPAINLRVAQDRTTTIRASVHDVEITLLISIVPGDPGGVRLSAQRLGHDHSQHCRAALAARHVRRDVSVRATARQSFADGADDLHRLRGGRRHRRDRKHHALSRTGHGADAGGAARARRRSASPFSR